MCFNYYLLDSEKELQDYIESVKEGTLKRPHVPASRIITPAIRHNVPSKKIESQKEQEAIKKVEKGAGTCSALR